MVAIRKISRQKQKKSARGRTLHDILHVSKKTWGGGWRITRRANAPNGMFSTFYFAAVSLRIHVEFLNDERGKERQVMLLLVLLIKFFLLWIIFQINFSFNLLVVDWRLLPEFWRPKYFFTAIGRIQTYHPRLFGMCSWPHNMADWWLNPV